MDSINRIPVAIAAAIIAGVLAGCGSDGDNNSNNSDVTTATIQSADFATACRAVASLSGFPQDTTITRAEHSANGALTANGVALPEHCIVEGTINARTGLAGINGSAPYGTKFQLRLPARTGWNGRFMYQGGGGTQGNVPQATGTAGRASPTLAKGYVVIGDNAGHDNAALPAVPNTPAGSSFFPDPQAMRDWGYGATDSSTRLAKFVIGQIYGKGPDRSYFVGCSTSGRQGMAMSQLFPQHYDGIVAGDPFFVPPAISLSEVNGVQAVKAISPLGTDGKPQYFNSFTPADLALFTKAILQKCDALDGLADGVIDDYAACQNPTTGFNPATHVFTDTGQPLQCTGAKTADCLSPAQVGAIQSIERGPRTSTGQKVVLPDGTVISGYPYDGGWMAPSGLPSRNIGTPTTQPGNLALGAAQIPLFWFTVPEPAMDVTLFNWDSDPLRVIAANNSPVVNNSTDIGIFRGRGGKILFYHGLSDGGPPFTYTVDYYNALAARFGGLTETQKFSRLYLIPNMGHCSGGPATDQFDFLTPMVDWVEKGIAPETVVASGTSFAPPPASRSRPLCSFPKVVRYTGPQPATEASVAAAASYSCQ